MDEWIRAHIEDVPRDTRDFCGDNLRGKTVLNVGCGEMLSDFGLLSLGPTSIMGLDLDPKPENWRQGVADKVHANGHDIDADYAERLGYTDYDGKNFPFAAGSFDVVFSWSAFEHVADVRAVLREIHRVLTDDGFVFVQVFPWFHSHEGSHLTQWIGQPFFHHVQNDGWVAARLNAHVEANPEADRGFVTEYMFREYRHLNRISSSDFYQAARDSGFVVSKARLIAHDQDLSQAPDGAVFADLMIGGTMMLLRKGGFFRALDRSSQL